MINFTRKTPIELNREIAKNITAIRKRRKISQKELSVTSGVSLGSIKRFEQEGEISLISLSKIAIALSVSDELENLWTDVAYNSIEEVINEQSK